MHQWHRLCGSTPGCVLILTNLSVLRPIEVNRVLSLFVCFIKFSSVDIDYNTLASLRPRDTI